jgi:protein FAM32A
MADDHFPKEMQISASRNRSFSWSCLGSYNEVSMPSSDYKNAISGGLKLKGAKDSGVEKKKKKKKPKPDPEGNDSKAIITKSKQEDEVDLEDDSAVQKALADEETRDNVSASKRREDEVKQYGKTEAQRRHEERRRKRVSGDASCGLVDMS